LRQSSANHRTYCPFSHCHPQGYFNPAKDISVAAVNEASRLASCPYELVKGYQET